MMNERRAFKRFTVGGKVELAPEDGTERKISAELCNMCFLGASISTSEKIECGDQVKFELVTRISDLRLAGKGKIVYVNEATEGGKVVYRMAVQFTDVDNNEVQRLLNFIQHDIIQKEKDKRKKAK